MSRLIYLYIFQVLPKICSRQHFKICPVVSESKKDLLFYVKLLLADDSHVKSSLIFPENQKSYKNMSSAAVMNGAFRFKKSHT